MERNIRIIHAYDGTDFHGWQTQRNVRTVQGVLEDTLRHVLRHDVAVIGSGRTDAGVHAAGQVANVVTRCSLDSARLRHAIESRLPPDLAILHVGDVHPAFDARRSALSKLYRYRIYNTSRRPVEFGLHRRTYHVWTPLDVDRMRAGARAFVGEMDFSSMAAAGCVRETMVRRVLRCDVERHLDEIRIDVEGTGFLYKQVRAMVGTLINVGRGKWTPEAVGEILESRQRANAGPTAPAHGLCLQWVRYPADLLSPPGREAPQNASPLLPVSGV